MHNLNTISSRPPVISLIMHAVQKRLEDNLKVRRKSRLSVFDRIRNLPRCESPAPAPLSEAQQKVEQRRKQLEKWKEDKKKREKELAAQKKKPFVAGVAPKPIKFVPPPPIKSMPSTSGRVTRSQAAKNNASKLKVDSKAKAAKVESKTLKSSSSSSSFAPNNATFRPPVIKNLTKMPTLTRVTETRNKNNKYTFNFNIKSNTAKVNNDFTSKQTEIAKPVETRMVTRRAAKETEKVSNDRVSKKSSVVQTVKARTTDNKKSTKKLTKAVAPQSSSENSSTEKSPILKTTTPIRTLKGTKSVTPKNHVPKSESSSEEKLRSPRSDNTECTPQVIERKISPKVTMSRGKSNARKEMKKKIEEGLLDEDNSDAENVEHFRRQLASEVARLNELCDTWDKIREQTVLAEPVQEEVLGAVGQGRLLVSSKLQQFAGLVERCARPEPGSPLITPADLHGFWDMVFMQIENVDVRFKRLEQQRARNWAPEPQDVPVKKIVAKNAAKKVAKPTAGPSRLREMIAAARKAKKEQEEQPQQPLQPQCESETEKTFEAGFFCVRSPVRTSAPATPQRKSLLKAVLSSEAKNNSSSFAMLRASILSKNLEADGIAPLPQSPMPAINMNATPGRSILKSSNISNVQSGKKSIKVVLFDDSDTDIQVNNKVDQNTDSGVSSLDQEDKENKSKSKPRLSRQDALEESGVVTRSRRKSLKTEETVNYKATRRSSRRKTLQENDKGQCT